jgi:hypothetical protein
MTENAPTPPRRFWETPQIHVLDDPPTRAMLMLRAYFPKAHCEYHEKEDVFWIHSGEGHALWHGHSAADAWLQAGIAFDRWRTIVASIDKNDRKPPKSVK